MAIGTGAKGDKVIAKCVHDFAIFIFREIEGFRSMRGRIGIELNSEHSAVMQLWLISRTSNIVIDEILAYTDRLNNIVGSFSDMELVGLECLTDKVTAHFSDKNINMLNETIVTLLLRHMVYVLALRGVAYLSVNEFLSVISTINELEGRAFYTTLKEGGHIQCRG